MNQRIILTSDDFTGTERIEAVTFDRYGGEIAITLSDEDLSYMRALFGRALELRPAHELEIAAAAKKVAEAKDAKYLAEQETRQAKAETAKALEAEQKSAAKAQVAEAEKVKAVRVAQEASARVVDLEARNKEANDKIAKLLTGGLSEEATTETILLYPELSEADYGRSIDTGEAFRIGEVLYVAKRNIDGLTADTMPTAPEASKYWRGGGIGENIPTPDPDYKYPAGTEVEYMGAMYYATIDTDLGPEVGYPTWDLLENKLLD
ncbi:MAG: hypothetical protein Q4E09_05910 [Eubacteriales bacterium]|nr:hypothetical protein [Eubacteriales bacterium]